jgi:hypothetical protein
LRFHPSRRLNAGSHIHRVHVLDELNCGEVNNASRPPPHSTPPGAFNALLSFSYSLAAEGRGRGGESGGLRPLLGCFHEIDYGRPSLPLDLMEEWRPLVAGAGARIGKSGQPDAWFVFLDGARLAAGGTGRGERAAAGGRGFMQQLHRSQ